MTNNIQDFITINRQKNGRIKITHDYYNEENIYMLLHDLWFRKTKLNNKKIYFRRDDSSVSPAKFEEIKNAFKSLLEKIARKNIPPGIEYSSILNWYYQKRPIRENALLNHYLEDILTESELHDLRLQVDCDYKHRIDVQQFLEKFNQWGFKKTLDVAGGISLNDPLYYKNVDDNKYLVFSHHNSDTKKNDGFGCWLANFSNEKQIGLKKPISLNAIKLSFSINENFPLVESYLQ